MVNTAGDALGSLAIGETLRLGEINYTLNLNDSLLSVTVEGPPPPTPSNLIGSQNRISWEGTRTAQCIVEFSTDVFEHAVQVVTTGKAVDMLDLPAGTNQWRVKAENSEEWAVGEAFVSEAESDTPRVVQSNEDGNDDLFFASTNGTWESIYYAQHNRLFGDAGNDRIVGASGSDVIVGGAGNDSLHDGGGDDVFAFCDNWGVDTVEQLADGEITLWFASGDESNWNAETLTYTDGTNNVTVSGIPDEQITLKSGSDGSEQFAALSLAGAFDDFTSQRIFEESNSGILASL